MFRTLIVGPAAVILGLAFALAFGLIGGAVVGLCILIWPFARLYDASNERLSRRRP